METVTLVLPVVAFLAVMAGALLVIGALAPSPDPVRQRLAGYGLEEAPVRTVSSEVAILRQRRLSTIPLLQDLLSGSRLAERWAAELAAAAVPLRVGEYLLLRWFAAVGMVLLGVVLDLPIFIVVAGGLFGFWLPKLFIRRRQQQRLQRIGDQLVDALSMMANSLKSGASALQAIDLVAHELPPPISEEFAQVVAEVSVGATLDDALANLARRVPSYDLYMVVTAMQIQRQTGGNLAEVLERVAHTLRERARLLREVQVRTAQQRFSALIVGLLPLAMLLILSVMSPGYHRPFIEHPIGRIILGVGFVFQVTGFLVMRRLARIDI
jgi:tight adherence protein B